LDNGASVVSITNSALVNYSSRKRLQIASSSAVVAQSLVAGSNQSGNSGNCQAVQGREVAASNGSTKVRCAVVSIVASNVGVNTSSCWIASINCAIGEVVAEVSGINWCMDASSLGIACVYLATISSIAIVSGILAKASCWIARFIGAHVVIIAVDRSGLAFPVHRVADIVRAAYPWASNVDAHIARSRWKHHVLASSIGRVAIILKARISFVAINGSISAPNCRIATRSMAYIQGRADNI